MAEEQQSPDFQLEALSHEELLERARQFEQEIRELKKAVFIDSVTGLPNRNAYAYDIERARANAQRFGDDVSLLMVDLDGFKEVNDTLGHQKGDEALKKTAEKLQSLLRSSDTVYRFGGDEFVVLLRRTNASGAQKVGNKLQNEDYSFEGIKIGLSFGPAQYGPDGVDAEALLKAADERMYENKRERQAGRNDIAQGNVEKGENSNG